MKQKTVQLLLRKNEFEALQVLLLCNPCETGCALEDMVNSRKDCDECRLTQAILNIENQMVQCRNKP